MTLDLSPEEVAHLLLLTAEDRSDSIFSDDNLNGPLMVRLAALMPPGEAVKLLEHQGYECYIDYDTPADPGKQS